MKLSREDKIKFIEGAFADAKVKSSLQDQIDNVVDTYYNSITEKGIIHRDDYLEFYNRILDTEFGYTEEDRGVYESDPVACVGKLNSYQAFLSFKKMLENETMQTQEDEIVFCDREFDIEEYREYFRKDKEVAITQLIME